jgi:hypothetical protein
MKVQSVTPYRDRHLQRYGVTVRGKVSSVYLPLDVVVTQTNTWNCEKTDIGTTGITLARNEIILLRARDMKVRYRHFRICCYRFLHASFLVYWCTSHVVPQACSDWFFVELERVRVRH